MTTNITINEIIADRNIENVKFDGRMLAEADALDASNTPWNEDIDELAFQKRAIADSALLLGETVGRLKTNQARLAGNIQLETMAADEAVAFVEMMSRENTESWDRTAADGVDEDDYYQGIEIILAEIKRLLALIIRD